MSILAQPDLCLFRIFDHLTIPELLNLGAVCTRWASLLPAACLRRRQLSIGLGDAPLKLLDDCKFAHRPSIDSLNQLEYLWFHEDIAVRLGNLFPNITTLTVAIRNIPSSSLVRVCALIDRFQSLVSLHVHIKLMGKETAITVQERILALFASINTLPSLKHHTVSYRHLLNFEEIKLPILAQLETFQFASLDHANTVTNSLEQFAQHNDKLGQIALFSPISDRATYERFVKLSNAPCFTHLSNRLALNESQLRLFVSRFSSLVYLELPLGTLMLSELTASLARLAALRELKLAMNFVDEHYQPLTEDQTTPSALPLLQSLHLSLHLSSHSQPSSPHLGKIFPSLVRLSIEHFFIRGCQLCAIPEAVVNDEAVQRCVNLLVQPWREQCTRLKRLTSIFGYSGEETVWLGEESCVL